jgi:L-asparaginase II
MSFIPMFEVQRAHCVESVHFGAVAVADAAGGLVASAGDPHTVTYMRSSAKPLQAMPLVVSGAAGAFGLSDQELAIVCASHTGRDEHVKVIASIQTKAGLSERDLACGDAFPSDEGTRLRMQAKGLPPSAMRHNCSGKHSGMLVLARHLGASLEGYLSQDHPVQRRIAEMVMRMTDLTKAEIAFGIDGCSAPNFALPLISAATAYARLMDSAGLDPELAKGCETIVAAMTAHPDMVAGPGRFDTDLMEEAAAGLVSKGGAEGFQALGIRADRAGDFGRGLGVAIKIADGDPRRRAAPAVAVSVLEHLGVLKSNLDALSRYAQPSVLNDRELTVGSGRVAFELAYGEDRGCRSS